MEFFAHSAYLGVDYWEVEDSISKERKLGSGERNSFVLCKNPSRRGKQASK